MAQQVFGERYLIQDKVGAGGMATVFRAQDQVLDRTVAVKVMLPQYASDPQFAARFKQEAQAAAALQSPYIVGIYDWGRDGETYYIVMEYLRGTDLKSGIRSHGALDPQKVAQIGSQICGALSVAHKHEIIHRDIKPQNIMVQPDGNIKVMDFGIARAKNSHLTQDNNVLGTAHYVSPEQTRGQALGPTSDLYSLGVVMYECATGRVPFDGDDAISVALKQVNELPVPPSQVNPAVDPTLERIILKCMEKDPAARFQTADELRQVLNNYIAGRAVDVAEPTRVIAGAAGAGVTKTQVMATPGSTTSIPRAGGAARTQASLGQTGSYGEDPKKGNRNKIIAGVIAGVVALIAIIAIAVGVFGGNDEMIDVPNVLDQTKENAVAMLNEAGLKPGDITSEYSESVPEGYVVDQDPDGGTKAKEGDRVNLVISKGVEPPKTVAVPAVNGMTEDEYKAALDAAGLKGVKSTEYSDTVEEGHVIRTEPGEGEQVEEGSTVTYVVSSGPDSVNIPGVLGKSEAEASNALSNAGFKVKVVYDYSDSYSEGTVMRQSPTGSAEEGSTVTITVSKGSKPKEPSTETPTSPESPTDGEGEEDGGNATQ